MLAAGVALKKSGSIPTGIATATIGTAKNTEYHKIFDLSYSLVCLPQHSIDVNNRYFHVVVPNIIMSFWNISKASAPIHIQATREK